MKLNITMAIPLLMSMSFLIMAEDEFNRETNLVVTPGTVIDANNVAQYTDALDIGIADLI